MKLVELNQMLQRGHIVKMGGRTGTGGVGVASEEPVRYFLGAGLVEGDPEVFGAVGVGYREDGKGKVIVFNQRGGDLTVVQKSFLGDFCSGSLERVSVGGSQDA